MFTNSLSHSQKENFQFSRIQISKRAHFINLSEFKGSWNVIYFVAFFSFIQDLFVDIGIAFQFIPTDKSDITGSARFLNNVSNFHDLFSYNPPSTALLTVCGCIVIYFIIMILSFFGVIYGTLKLKEQQEFFLAKVWSYLIQIHPAVVFLPVSNICGRVQAEYRDNNLEFSDESDINIVIFGLSVVVTILNILFAILPYVFLFTVLPSKNPLAAKSMNSEKAIIYHKLMMSLTCMLLPDGSFTPWFVLVLNFLFSIIRISWTFYTLPRYSFRMLWLDLFWTKLSVYISSMTGLMFIANQLGAEYTIVSLITGSSLMIPVVAILNYSSFQWNIRNILFTAVKSLNPYKAFHKVLMLKYLQREMKDQNERQFSFDKHYFYLSTMNACVENIFQINIGLDKRVNFRNKEIRHTLKRKFLETIVEHFRSSNLLKLILARFYAHNLKLYALAIKTLSTIKSQHPNTNASVNLLHIQIQNEVLKQSRGKQSQLGIYEYIVISDQQEQFKNQIQKHVNLLQDFWKEHSKNDPNIMRIQQLSQAIETQKSRVGRKWTSIEQKFHDSLNSLYLIYSQYQFVCNDSFSKAEEYLTKHYLYAERENRITNQQGLADFDASNNNKFIVTIHTDSKKLGNIANCSKSIETNLGYKTNLLIGTNIQALMTPFIAERHNYFIQDYLKTGKTVTLGKMQSTFVKNKSGFLQKAIMNVNLHPFINQELLLTGLFQTVQDTHEYILVTPDGKIDSYTSGIASKLGLSNNRLFINDVCADFELNPCDGNKTDLESVLSNIEDRVTEDRLVERDLSNRKSLRLLRHKKTFSSFSQKRSTYFNNRNEEPKDIQSQFPKKQNLVFQHSSWNTDEKMAKKTFEYECNISLNPVQNESMYTIEINMFDIRDENPDVASPEFPVLKAPADEEISEDLKDYELEEAEQDEKAGGWFRAEAMYLDTPAEKGLVPMSPMSDARTNVFNFTENTPIIPMRTDMITSERPMLVKEKFLSEENEEQPTRRKMHSLERKKRRSITNNSRSEVSSKGAQRRVQSYVQEALKTFYLPKMVYTMLAVCAIVIPGLFVDQLYFGISASNNLNTVRSLTETLDLSISAVNAFARLDVQVRASASVNMGIINGTSQVGRGIYSSLYSESKTLVPVMKDSYGQLNNKIQEIDESFQENFRRKDIMIVNIDAEVLAGGNFTYQIFDTFTAMTLLVDRFSRLQTQYTKSKTYSLEDLSYILTNSANDLFLKVVSTITDILQATQTSISDTLRILTTLQIVCSVLLFIAVFIVYYHIYKFYQEEIKLMQLFIKISPTAVSQLQNQLDKLGKMLEDHPHNTSKYLRLESDSDAEIQDASAKVIKIQKTVDPKELKRHYLKRFFIFLCNLACFYSIYALMAVMTIELISTFKKKVDRLYTTQSLNYQVSTLGFGIAQVAGGDNQSTILNRPVDEIINLQLQNILSGVNGLFAVYKNEDGTIDPGFSAILSDNACDYVPATTKRICAYNLQGATNIGLLGFLSKLHTSASTAYLSYKDSNQTSADQQALINDFYGDTGVEIVIVREILNSMASQVRKDFYETWDQASSQVVLITALELLLLSISGSISLFVCFLEPTLYFHKFKKVLKVVPTHILVKNSALKGLLIMSSNGKLDAVKNEI